MKRFIVGRRSPSETGATAVAVSLMSLLLFSCAAIAVDLGSALVRKGENQQQADIGALAGAAELPGIKSASDQSVIDVANYLNRNQSPDDRYPRSDSATPACRLTRPASCVTPSQLVDGNDSNGEVYFIKPTRLRVIAPTTQVNFGFAPVFNVFRSGSGVSYAQINSDATVMIGTGAKTLPFFVADTCSYLQQTIVDPANGQDAPVNPVLSPAGNPAYGITLRTATPDEATLGANPGPVRISAQGGQAMDGVAKIGFTTENFGVSQPSLHHEVAVTPRLTGGSSYDVAVPQEVYNTEALWYIRVWRASDSSWSEDSIPFPVGAPPMYCAGSQSGNFGSLNISRGDSTHGSWVAMNTALGLQQSVAVHPAAPAAPTPCRNQAGSVIDPGSPNPNGPALNCLETEPGLVSQATAGLITGVGGYKGLLDTSIDEHKTTCDPSGGTADRSVTISGKGTFSLNNDALTCYITDPTVSLGDVSRRTGAPDDVISPEIFSSPRFFYLPVLPDDPTNGRSGTWPIIGFRAAFISGQPNAATPTAPMASETDLASNGVITDNNGVQKIRVVLLNEASFPETADIPGDVIEYIGSGTKIIRMID